MCEKCVRICNVIGELNSQEGNSVTIFAANPEFSGDDYAIEACGDWSNWEAERFGGDSIAEALEKAVEQKRLAEQPNQVDMALAEAGMLHN